MKEQEPGNSMNTPRKTAWFAKLLRCSLRASNAPAVASFPYWHLDLNAGRGWNVRAECPGSVLIFLEEAARIRRSFRAVACDSNKSSLDECKKRAASFFVTGFPSDSAEMGYFPGDNADCLKEFSTKICTAERSPYYSVGTVLCDPNGFRGCPVAAMREFFDRHPRIDCILNINASLFQMVEAAIASKTPNVPNVAHFLKWPVQRLADFPAALGKKNWFVVLPKKQCNHQRFVIFYGFNGGQRELPRHLLPLDDPNAQAFLQTYRRIDPDQGYLFPGQWEGRNP